MQIARAILFWLGFYVWTFVITAILSVSFIFPFHTRFKISRAWAWFNLCWLKVTCGVDHHIQGLEKIPDEAVIFMSKHQSTWETLTYQLYLPPTVWVLKRELLRIPVFGWGLAMLNPIAINRNLGKKALKQLLTDGLKHLQSGISIMIFPEGTRTTAGEPSRYRPGGAMLGAKSGHRIVPMAHNAGYFWPRGQFFPNPGTITVVIGEPIDTVGKSASEILQEVETWIESTMTTIDH